MNEDKELEEAIKRLNKKLKSEKELKKISSCTEIVEDIILDNQAIETVLKELNQKNEIINLMSLAILNYDDQLVINKYRDLEDVKNHFQELSKED